MSALDDLIPVIATAGGAAIGGPAGAAVGASLGNAYAQSQANKQNIAQADKQMAFQERMSSTAHQREVADLKAAGLHPNLSTHGAGSSSPSGASANIAPQQIAMPDLMAYGVSLKQLELQEKELGIKGSLAAADISKKMSDTDLTKMKKILAQKGMVRAELEGETSTILHKAIKWLKNSTLQQPGTPTVDQRARGAYDTWKNSQRKP